MAITEISRDWGSEPSIVRIVSTNTLAQVGTNGYLLAQADEIEALNAGAFQWQASDMVLVYASDGWGFFTIDPNFEDLNAFVFVPGVTGATVIGNVPLFDSVNGNLIDSGAAPSDPAQTIFVMQDGASVIGNLPQYSDVDGTIEDSGIAAADLLDATLAANQIFVGSAGNVATAVAMSGDATIVSAGTVTLGAVVNAAKAATYAPEAVIAGSPVLHVFNMAGGATATRTIATAQKITVVDAWVVLKGLGTAGDTIEVKNAAGTAITDAIDINDADETISRASTIDDAARVVAAAANLQCTETDGGGADSPACDVYVLCYVTP